MGALESDIVYPAQSPSLKSTQSNTSFRQSKSQSSLELQAHIQLSKHKLSLSLPELTLESTAAFVCFQMGFYPEFSLW